MQEWDGAKFTGSTLCVKVTYILQDAEKYGLKDGYIIMGVRHIESSVDFKPMTNADRIRQMTDEELAENICSRCCPEKDAFYNCVKINKKTFSWEDCKRCWLDWLKQEVDE